MLTIQVQSAVDKRHVPTHENIAAERHEQLQRVKVLRSLLSDKGPVQGRAAFWPEEVI
jgi:hypothetical protein